jgi:hypothetical protein
MLLYTNTSTRDAPPQVQLLELKRYLFNVADLDATDKLHSQHLAAAQLPLNVRCFDPGHSLEVVSKPVSIPAFSYIVYLLP